MSEQPRAMQVQQLDWPVISLARTPHRLEAFMAFNDRLKVPFSVFTAVDGETLDRQRLIDAGVITPQVENWSMGAIGSALSHRALWQNAIAADRPAAIFEDDVVLRGDFLERTLDLLSLLPVDWDIVLLGFNTDASINLRVIPGFNIWARASLPQPQPEDCAKFAALTSPVAPILLNNAFGISAYLISPRGARQLQAALFPLQGGSLYLPAFDAHIAGTTIDIWMNGLYPRLNAYLCMPPLALPINNKQSSTVGA